MPSIAAQISAIAKYQQMGIDVTGAIAQLRMDDGMETIKRLATTYHLDAADVVNILAEHYDRLNCGPGSHFCSSGKGKGACIPLHAKCSHDEVSKERMVKARALAHHLQQGGEDPRKGLNKPGAAQLHQVAADVGRQRDLQAANMIAKRKGDRMAAAKAAEEHLKANYPELHTQIEAAANDYRQQHAKTGKLLEEVKSGANSLERSARDIQAENAEQIGNPALLADVRQKAKVEADRQMLEESIQQSTRRPSMTVGPTVPNHKPPQLIPQAKAFTPEVLPPETPKTRRSRAERDADHARIKSNLEDAARHVASAAILQHASYQTAKGQEVSPESIKNAQQAAGDMAVAKLQAGSQQKALPGTGRKRRFGSSSAESAKESIKAAAESTANAAVAHHAFMQTAMAMAQENDKNAQPPQSGRSRKIAKLVEKLQSNHEADTRNAAQIYATAHEALRQVDPSHTVELPAPKASTFTPPTGTPRQRVAKLLENLQENETASSRNAAAALTVAQMAVNKLKKKEAGEKGATETKAIAPAKRKKRRKDITAAPVAGRGRSRTAGDIPGYAGTKNHHVSIDSLSPAQVANAIASLNRRGIRIDAATTLDLLKRADCGDDCECSPCMAKAKRKKQAAEKADALGDGSKFAALVAKLMQQKGMGEDEAKAIAAKVGREKYGKTKFQKLATAGR